MKNKVFVKTVLISALLGLLAPLVTAGTQSSDSILLRPTMQQRYATNLATRFLTNWHYKETRLNDQLSSMVFDQYIELLDPNRSYFLATDMRYFERYRAQLDDSLSHAELDPAYEVFNIYVDRVRERVRFANAQLEGEFSFEVDESFRFDRSEAPWATTQTRLDDIWRKRVKNDYLRLMLTGKEDEAIRSTLQERYENLERRITELNGEDVFQFFMNSVTRAIEPHTSYLSPRTSENFEISMKLSLEGIGALLDRQTEYTSIARVVPGGPADLDGRLKVGDRIIGVGQGLQGNIVDVIGWRLDDVVDKIRGPKDSVVRLEILPADMGPDSPTDVIDLVRNEVKLEEQAAQKEVIEVPLGDSGEVMKIGLIDLPVFYLDFAGRAMNKSDYRSSTRDVKRLIGELREEGVAGIIMDLRNNGGGSLLEATSLTGLFIDTGPVVQVRDSRGRVSIERDEDPGMTWDGPLAVLVNRYSASASEIFAAAIQDYGRGVIIGEPTFGKGTVQNLIDLDDYAPADRERMGQLKLTMAQFFRVNGGSTQNKGVVPDVRFPSAGVPDEWGESSLDNALPWTQIDATDYQAVGDISNLVAVVDTRYDTRIRQDEEFAWLRADIEEYKEHSERTTISLLESVRRTEMDEAESKREQRKRERALRNGDPVPEPEPAEPITDNPAESLVESIADDEEKEDDYDLLQEEAARILSDIVELERNRPLLAQELELVKKADQVN